MGNGPDGVVYSPQKYMFAYNSFNELQEQLVDEALRQGEEEWNALPDCACSRYKFTPTMYDGRLPMVCAGVSAKYHNKGLPKSETLIEP